MSVKIKKLSETSRGGRRQLELQNDEIRETCEWVSRQSGCSLQSTFNELISMFTEGYLYGVGTKGVLFARMTEKVVKK